MIGKTNSGMIKIVNIIGIATETSGATITATSGSKVYTTTTDSTGYGFFTNLDVGTWTLQATKTGKYVGPRTLTITATQSVYYIKYPFRTYVYDGSLNSGGENGANVCKSFSGGWVGSGGGGVITYETTNVRWLGDSAYIHRLYNVTPIDLTPYNTLYITCQAQRTGGKAGIIQPSSTTWRTSVTSSTTSKTTLSVDVSTFNNVTGRVCFGDAPYIDLHVYAAWFE